MKNVKRIITKQINTAIFDDRPKHLVWEHIEYFLWIYVDHRVVDHVVDVLNRTPCARGHDLKNS